MKSALRIYLSVSYVMIGILLIGSLRSPPPIRAAPDCPLFRGQNKTPRNALFISGSTVSTGYSAPACGGKVVAPATKGGAPSPAGRLYGFSRQRRHKKWRPKGRHTFPAERYYIPPEGGSTQPACKAKPITGRTLAAQGQRPGGWLNPHARKGVSTYGNTGKHRPDPDSDPDRTITPIKKSCLAAAGRWKLMFIHGCQFQ